MPEPTKNSKVATGYRYRMETRPDQARRLNELAGACRWVWNHFLHWREDAYLAARSAGGTLQPGAFSYVSNAAELTRLRKRVPWLRDADITGLQQTLRDLDRAFERFFAGEAGYPRPRHRGDDRYRVCGQASFGVADDWVQLPKLGWLRFRKSRDLPGNGRILNVTVSREGRHWFVSFCVEHARAEAPSPAGDAVGLDLGVVQSVTMSTGDAIEYPVSNANESQLLKRLHRHVSRKQRGSRRRSRAVERLARRKRTLAARVRDCAHKLTTRLATGYREIHVEDLRIKSMTASARGTPAAPGRNVRAKAGLNRSMLAQAHGQTVRLLTYKCARSGAQLIFKNPAHTSQECAECGHIDPANRPSQAVFRCVNCGHHANADVNAARVVLKRPAGGPSVAARRGKRKSPPEGRCSDEARTHPRIPDISPVPTGIPVNAAHAA